MPGPHRDLGLVHMGALVAVVVLLGAIVDFSGSLRALLPVSLQAKSSALVWGVCLALPLLYIPLCLTGLPSGHLRFLGSFGTRGECIALTFYRISVDVTPSEVTVTNHWWGRRRTCRFPRDGIVDIKSEKANILFISTTGEALRCETWLEPPQLSALVSSTRRVINDTAEHQPGHVR